MSEDAIPFRGIYNDPKVYRTLDVDAKEIRYLSIAPGSGDDSLVCSLGYTSLEDEYRTQYEALSYTWGDLQETVEMTLRYPEEGAKKSKRYREHRYKITPNLRSALRNLRKETRPRILWVDAVCINQVDAEERTQQVRIMGEVYSLACRVLVWLGDADLFSAIAIHVIRICRDLKAAKKEYDMGSVEGRVGDMFSQLNDGYRELRYSESVDFIDKTEFKQIPRVLLEALIPLAVMGDEEAAQDMYGAMSLMDLPWEEMDSFERTRTVEWIILQCVNELLGRPWFKRIWVVQEVFRAPRDSMGNNKAIAHLGGMRMYWTDLCESLETLAPYLEEDVADRVRNHDRRALEHLSDFLGDPRIPDMMVNDTSDLQFFRRNWGKVWRDYRHYGKTICEWLLVTCDFQSSDPRDKLYAMMLLGEATRTTLNDDALTRPDYGKTPQQVLTDFVRWHIQKSGTLDMLCWISPLQSSTVMDYRPSWVPDLLNPSEKWPFAGLLNVLTDYPGFLVGPTPDSHRAPIRIGASSLLVRGIKLSQVRLVIRTKIYFEKVFERVCIQSKGQTNELFEFLLEEYWDPRTEPSDAGFLRKCFSIFGCLDGSSLHGEILNNLVEYIRRQDIPLHDPETWDYLKFNQKPRPEWTVCEMVQRFSKDRCLFICEDGSFGMCPDATAKGDVLVALETGKVPFLLRRAGTNSYSLVGSCLLYDQRGMAREAERHMEKYNVPLEVFELL
jgi:hypothetical protein